MWDEIQDMEGEIFDIEDWREDMHDGIAEFWHDLNLDAEDPVTVEEVAH